MVETIKTYKVKVIVARDNTITQDEADIQVITDLFNINKDYDRLTYKVDAVAEVKENKSLKVDYEQLFKDFSTDIADCLKECELEDYKVLELSKIFEKYLDKVKIQ